MATNAVELDFDVLVVGYGPTGQAAAILLGQRGWRVGVVERWPKPYDLPRAVHFDDESARVLASAGVGEKLGAVSRPAHSYEWRTGTGETLLRFDWSGLAASGWPKANMVAQPDLERLLDDRARRLPSVRVMRGWEAVGVVQQADRAELTVRDGAGEPHVLGARYLIGCDGAGGIVRDTLGTSTTDLGFRYDWLIVDVIPHAPEAAAELTNLQVCDPVRPTTAVSGGPGRRRWEFMRLPGESVEELGLPDTAWLLLGAWGVTPRNATLERHTVYTFEARWADHWRAGRLLIAGDAAHLMPPFAGQGMCSGLRDAANLAWKLDLVLRGISGPELLDTYETERVPQIRYTVEVSAFLGGIICVTDPAEAASRDAGLLRARADGDALTEPPPPPLGPGVVRAAPGGADEALAQSAVQASVPPAGELCPQWRVRHGDRVGLLDEIVGTGFTVLADGDPADVLAVDQAAFLDVVGARLVRVVPAGAPDAGAGTVTDVDGLFLPYLRRHGWALVVRPDFYLFGAAARPDDLPPLVDDLRSRLCSRLGAGVRQTSR